MSITNKDSLSLVTDLKVNRDLQLYKLQQIRWVLCVGDIHMVEHMDRNVSMCYSFGQETSQKKIRHNTPYLCS